MCTLPLTCIQDYKRACSRSGREYDRSATPAAGKQFTRLRNQKAAIQCAAQGTIGFLRKLVQDKHPVSEKTALPLSSKHHRAQCAYQVPEQISESLTVDNC